MRFLENYQADATLDLVFRLCPIHLLEPPEFLKALRRGQTLEILTDYDGALNDIPAWCEKNGQEFIGIDEDEENEYYKLYVRRLK